MMLTSQQTTTERRFEKVVQALLSHPGVTPPLGTRGSRGFGSSGLRINNKIFAMLSSQGRFVVKLPRQRVDALVASGAGQYFDPGHGRLMKEWLAVEADSEKVWLRLAREAMEFVGAKTPGES